MSGSLPGWAPRPRPQRVALEGRYCRLEPLDPVAHADALFAALGHLAKADGRVSEAEIRMALARQ